MIKTMFSAAAIALASGLALAGCGTLSEPSMSTVDRVFVTSAPTWDLDKDSVITCDEWKAYVAQLFRETKAARDGVLTRDEFRRMATIDRLFDTADFAYFDANGDGSVTLAEVADKPNPAFRHLDRNQDCRIDYDEFPSQWTRALSQSPTQRGRRGP